MVLLTVFFRWMYKMKYSCYQESSLIMAGFYIEFLVEKCAACLKVGNPTSDGTFLFFTLLDA